MGGAREARALTLTVVLHFGNVLVEFGYVFEYSWVVLGRPGGLLGSQFGHFGVVGQETLGVAALLAGSSEARYACRIRR